MITNIGMKYKLHQVLFNHQVSLNQPSSGLPLQQTSNLVHFPTVHLFCKTVGTLLVRVKVGVNKDVTNSKMQPLRSRPGSA